MKKYVSFRIEKMANEKIIKQINHDFRKGPIPKYINKDLSYKNQIIYGEKYDNEKLKDLQREQNKRSKRKIQKNTERFYSGIMTFSSEMKNDYKKNPELFKKLSQEFLQKLESEYKMQIVYADLHLDETTPHIHLLFDNISKENGKSIRRNINPEKLSQIQTLFGNIFKSMGYLRGEDKNSTNAKRFDFKDYHKVEAELEHLKNERKSYINDLKIFEKIAEGIPLNENDKEILKAIAPAMFQFIDKSKPKQKKELSDNISKILKI